MKRNKAVIALGVIFGVSLGVVSYLYLVLGIAFGLAGIEIMAHAWWIFAGLAVTTIVMSCFAKKQIKISRLGLTIAVAFSAIAHIFSLIQFANMGALEPSSVILFMGLFVSLAIGLVAMILAYKCKVQKKESTQQTTQE